MILCPKCPQCFQIDAVHYTENKHELIRWLVLID